MPNLGSAASLGITKNEDQYYDSTTVIVNFDGVANGSSSALAQDYSKNRYALSLPTASSSTVTTSTTKFPGGALNSSTVPTNLAYNQTTFTKCVDVAAGCAAFGTGDFTIEYWYYPVASSARDQNMFTTCCPGTSLNGGYNGATTKGWRLSQQASTRAFRWFNDVTVTGGTAPYSFLWNNGSTSEDLTSVLPGTYYVTMIDANGCEQISFFTVDITVGIEQVLKLNALKVYPNPAAEKITIDLGIDALATKIVLVDPAGKVVFEDFPNSNNFDVNVEKYAEGTYLLNIYVAQEIVVKRNVITR
jgi:hypothetical protein